MLSVGIVGLPNVGKSTLFNALLKKQQALAANYPFATIEPNVGVVPMPDDRLASISSVVEKNTGKSPKIIPTTVTFTDIAGIVKGASEGEGLGNQFLAHIREVSAITFVVRAFKDGDVVETGVGDFGQDLQTVRTELALADLETVEKQREPRHSKDKEEIRRWEIIQKVKEFLEAGAFQYELSEEESEIIRDLHLLTQKKSLYIVNVSEDDLASENIRQDSADKLGVDLEDVIIICAKVESELAGLDLEDQKEYLKDLGVEKGSLETLIKSAYKKLNLISFLTAGEKEVRSWTIKSGSTAPQAAGVIHTDFEKSFIKAKVVSVADYLQCVGWAKAKDQGKIRMEGKDYIVREDDIIEFMTSA